jgi:hypothetical protein
MSKLNKVITTFQQDFTSAEKAQACKNIGAIRGYTITPVSGSHQISQSEASSGVMSFNAMFSGVGGIVLYDVGIEVPPSANLGQNMYPVIITLDLTFEGGGTAALKVATGVLCRTSQNANWHLYTNFVYDFDIYARPLTNLMIRVDWGEQVIPQSTEIVYTIRKTMLKVPSV